MAFEGFQITVPGAIAGADLSAATTQFKFVKNNGTDDTVILCSAATDIILGVLQAPAPTASTGQPVNVCAFGVTKLQAGGSLTAGNLITTNTAGQAAAAAGSDYTAGQVLNVSGGTSAGNYITAIVWPASIVHA